MVSPRVWLRVILASLLSCGHALVHLRRKDAMVPKLSVMVIAARQDTRTVRDVVRKMWHEVDDPQGQLCMRFAFCNSPVDAYEASLHAEKADMGDLLFLNCEEGYGHGDLTKKVIKMMEAYVDHQGDDCLNRDLLLKVDMDTFVAGHNFRHALNNAWAQHGATIYAGCSCKQGEPERDPQSRWYEPYSVWPYDYPLSMCGGSGYILGRSLVQQIIDEGLPEKYLLWNEDRAVAVWIGQLQHRGTKVNWVNIPGTNGFEWDEHYKSGPWGSYPFALHHGVDPLTMACMTDLDKVNDPHQSVDHCFTM
mmetsp:Transcript_63252/g.150875  ORF Transcript_63252/g.150875 Transcript_63252/m.150875 type:complete len:306 (-) Transcript_63252:125-1042(-)|eukprot:CAMPEP_0178406518 /NCGR_PEP_ID=MMETSP0689_2-20121128/18952_1 /TAXON_ID=160604 /ORGANISM="Amphidinium massartii, Strain CS-259" /LENGTH=305 /DNA_ID=CAMNT_0020027559 /DNA_START=158 /DNA_END=1075 /DNA_ORIENTATION=-